MRKNSYFELAGAGTPEGAGEAGELPGICEAALLSTGAGIEAGETSAAPSKTLPVAAGRRLPK